CAHGLSFVLVLQRSNQPPPRRREGFMRNWFKSWSRQLRSSLSLSKANTPRNKRPRRLRLEPLEERVCPSIASPPNQLLPTGTQPIAVQLGRIDNDTLADIAILGTGGSLTTALNDGANGWTHVQTVSLGVGQGNGLVLGGFSSAH